MIEAFYSVQRKHSLQSILPVNIPTIARVSSCNILAFVTPTSLQDTQFNAWGSHLYVCDLTSPWNTYKVTSSKTCITALEWDIAGKHLLVGESEGSIQIWVQKDYYLSEWIQLYSITLPGEKILKAIFYHNGRRILFSSDKRDIINYMEKFQRAKYSPSVRHFGGVSSDGCLVLTTSGLLGTFLLPLEQSLISSNNSNSTNTTNNSNNTSNINTSGSNVSQMNTTQQLTSTGPYKLSAITQSLGAMRNYLATAAIAYGKTTQQQQHTDESFRIAVANAETRTKKSDVVQCYRVIIKFTDGKLTMTSQSLPSFFLFEGAGRDLPGLKITHLCWASNEEPDSLIVVAKHSTGIFVELWSLVEKVTPIHKLLQTNKTEVYKTIAWTNQANFRHGSSVIDISVSKLHFDTSYVYLTMSDSSIQIFGKDLKPISTLTTSAINLFENNSEHACKQSRIGVQLISHDVSYFGHLLIALDNQGQIYVYKLPQAYNEQCGNQQSLISHLTSLFEYSIITGYDPVDVFVSIRPNLIEQVIDKLTENFTRQPSFAQQYYYVNFLTTKTNLYRLIVSGQSKANDLTNLLMLHSILIAFKSLLRPSDLPNHDKGPAENLAMVLSESVPDVDKVLLNLDAKDFTVEPSTLQSLQQLIQWVADLALNILARLPQNGVLQMGQSKNTGYEISKDIVALNSIRELLVMIRIWGLLNTQCLPVFLRSVENLDILATLFRLLTRLALNPTEPDEGLLDECCLLPSQVLIPQLQSAISITSITSPVLHLNTFPLQLTYDVEPESLKFWKDYPLIEGGLANDGMIDSIRNLLLGKRPFSVRRCTRCGTLSSVNSVAKTTAMRAWEQRWANNCRCGGFWIYQKS